MATFHNRQRGRVITTALAIAVMAAVQSAAAREIEDILRVLRERQDRFHTAEVTWDSSVVKTSLGNLDANKPGKLIELPQSESTLYLKGTKLRLEHFIFNNDRDPALSQRTPRTLTFDGSKEMRLIIRSGSQKHHIGFVKPQVLTTSEWNNCHLAPLLLYFRPLLAGLMGTKDATPFTLGGSEQIDGVEYQKISRTVAAANAREEILLSNDGSCLPVRYAHFIRGVKVVHADIEYEARHGTKFPPARWNVSLLRNGHDILESSTGIVKEVKINEEMSDSLFSIVFPPNTLVTEIGEKEKAFIVDDNGKWVPIEQYRPSQTSIPWSLRWGINIAIIGARTAQ